MSLLGVRIGRHFAGADPDRINAAGSGTVPAHDNDAHDTPVQGTDGHPRDCEREKVPSINMTSHEVHYDRTPDGAKRSADNRKSQREHQFS
jgi:hypothetical protein